MPAGVRTCPTFCACCTLQASSLSFARPAGSGPALVSAATAARHLHLTCANFAADSAGLCPGQRPGTSTQVPGRWIANKWSTGPTHLERRPVSATAGWQASKAEAGQAAASGLGEAVSRHSRPAVCPTLGVRRCGRWPGLRLLLRAAVGGRRAARTHAPTRLRLCHGRMRISLHTSCRGAGGRAGCEGASTDSSASARPEGVPIFRRWSWRCWGGLRLRRARPEEPARYGPADVAGRGRRPCHPQPLALPCQATGLAERPRPLRGCVLALLDGHLAPQEPPLWDHREESSEQQRPGMQIANWLWPEGGRGNMPVITTPALAAFVLTRQSMIATTRLLCRPAAMGVRARTRPGPPQQGGAAHRQQRQRPG